MIAVNRREERSMQATLTDRHDHGRRRAPFQIEPRLRVLWREYLTDHLR